MIVLEHEADLVQAEIGQLIAAEIPDVGAFHRDAAGVRPENAGEHAQQCRLAASRGPHDIQHFAKIGLEADISQGLRSGFAFAKPLDDARLL